MRKWLFMLAGLYLLLYFAPLGSRPMVAPDEMRYGEMAAEMIHSGDWVVPRLMELRYFEKPILGHWLNAGSMLLFGENRFGIRFASALSVGLAALAVFLLVRRERDEKTGLLAAFVLITSAIVQVLGMYSSLDGMVASFVTLALSCFYPALSAAGKKRAGWLLLTGLFVGCAFLVKGFLAIAIPVMVIGGFLLLQRRWKDLLTMPWLPLVGILVVSLPWSIAIALREPDFWNYFFWEEHIHRFFAQGEAQHAEPFWYFVPVVLLGALPWTLVAPAPLFKTIKGRWADPFVRFCGLWFALPFLFFSASSGKLGTYILPCFPPLAILLAMGLADPKETDERFLRTGARILLSVFSLGFIGLGITALLPMESVKLYQPWEYQKYAFAMVGLLVSATLAFWALRHGKRPVRLACFGLSVAVGVAFFQFCLPESRSVSISMDRFLDRQKEHIPPDALVVTDSRAFTAVGWVLGRPDAYILGRQGELDYGLAYKDAANRYIGKSPEELIPFFAQHRDRPIVLVGRHQRFDPVFPRLPEPVYQDRFRYLRLYLFEPQTPKGTP